MEQQPIVARCIVEILGTPKEYITKALQDHVNRVKQDGVDIQIEKYAEPVQQDKLFSQFVELQIKFKNLQELLDFCFDSMPSTVEIISPQKIEVDMAQLEAFLNDFQGKLHHTDVMLKGLQAQKKVLDLNALNVVHNFIKWACKTKPHSIEDLSNILGIGTKELTPFVDSLVKKGALRKEDQVYITNG